MRPNVDPRKYCPLTGSSCSGVWSWNNPTCIDPKALACDQSDHFHEASVIARTQYLYRHFPLPPSKHTGPESRLGYYQISSPSALDLSVVSRRASFRCTFLSRVEMTWLTSPYIRLLYEDNTDFTPWSSSKTVAMILDMTEAKYWIPGVLASMRRGYNGDTCGVWIAELISTVGRAVISRLSWHSNNLSCPVQVTRQHSTIKSQATLGAYSCLWVGNQKMSSFRFRDIRSGVQEKYLLQVDGTDLDFLPWGEGSIVPIDLTPLLALVSEPIQVSLEVLN